jgi:cytochrome P450
MAAMDSELLTAPTEGVAPSKIDKTLSGFIDQLFLQRRRTAMVGPRGGAIVSDPATVDVILGEPARFPKTFGLLEAVGKSRFSTNGADWQRRRDLTQSHYLRAASSRNREKIAEIYQRRLDTCTSSEPAEISRALLAASTEIFYGALGCTVDVDSMLRFFDHARGLLKRLQYFSLIPASAVERTALNVEARLLLKSFETEIEKSPALEDMVGKFQAQANVVGAEELMMNFFAAVESTTATLSTAINRLGMHQQVQDSLASDPMSPQLDWFINEVLRYYPSIPFFVRQVALDTGIERLRLKKGSVIIVSIIGVHRHPDYWKDPERFDCSRSEFVENNYDRRAFIPFSSGIRSCGGAKLARLELIEGLKAFIQRFIVKRQGEDISFEYVMAMRPNSWDCLTIAKRAR